MDLIIDGYNLIGSEQGLHGALEHKRNALIRQLSQYQEIKRFTVTVVFDGWRSGSVNEVAEKKGRISIVYSRLGEKADAVIVRVARTKGGGCVVVTSDREIRNAVERFDAVAISAGEFNEILRGLDGAFSADDEFENPNFNSSRNGNAARLSKSERRRNDKLKKLRL